MDLSTVIRYHDATKHHFQRYARSLGYLDWATQPDPFRRFAGAPIVSLSRRPPPAFTYDDLFTPAPPESPGADLERVSWLLRYSLGLSAWKQYGRSRWALRVNPSSGNLHPTEAYVLTSALDETSGTALYHYAPEAHVLERRSSSDSVGAASPTLVALTTIHWREAWKYGERAFRYCQHDTGHAVAALALAARMLGWHARLIPSASTEQMSALLGVDRTSDFTDAEREEPQCVIEIGARSDCVDVVPPAGDRWAGVANTLSRERVDWPIIDDIAVATRLPGSTRDASRVLDTDPPKTAPRDIQAPALILQRRSAVAFDAVSRIDRETFVRLITSVIPSSAPPWATMWWRARIHLGIFVHRVDGIDPGLYLLMRHASAEPLLRAELQREFQWSAVPGVPDTVPLYCLARGDCRRLSARVSCDQEIASDGFFSLAMIAEFEPALEDMGPAAYRLLFWESGVVGQVLYLEAEAAGARATGIGCFYDEPVHEVFGIFSHRLQSLYHFTVGMPVEDTRLTTERGYAWETGRQG
jgi:SagB-type dehydrogenase family enzyme